MKYAVCDVCKGEMKPGSGCVQVVGELARVPHSDSGNCHDCNVAKGKLHHEGCDWERCAKCGGQRLSCECDAEGDA